MTTDQRVSLSEAAALAQYPPSQRQGLLARIRRGAAIVKPGYETDGVLDARTLRPVARATRVWTSGEVGQLLVGPTRGAVPARQAGAHTGAAYARGRGVRIAGVPRMPRSCLPKALRR